MKSESMVLSFFLMVFSVFVAVMRMRNMNIIMAMGSKMMPRLITDKTRLKLMGLKTTVSGSNGATIVTDMTIFWEWHCLTKSADLLLTCWMHCTGIINIQFDSALFISKAHELQNELGYGNAFWTTTESWCRWSCHWKCQLHVRLPQELTEKRYP